MTFLGAGLHQTLVPLVVSSDMLPKVSGKPPPWNAQAMCNLFLCLMEVPFHSKGTTA